MTTKWNDEKIVEGIKQSMGVLKIDRMPTAAELTSIGRNDLHCKIGRTKTYKGWADYLGIQLKSSETTKGNEYEDLVAKIIGVLGYKVKQMTTKHPYDLLINDSVKVDVKVGGAHNHFGSRAHTFRPSKKFATCDLYICVALDENDGVENIFIIPSKFAQLTTLNIGTDSKYNKFIYRWDYIKRFVQFYEEVV
jgi:hypothetical protein